MALENELKEMLVRELKLEDVNPGDIDENEPLFGDGLGLDSLDAVELVVLLQRHYQIEIKDMDEGRTAFTSVKSLADFVRQRQGES
ncbi:acyl carrier protein [bacterium]|nr:acyl carrier protein [bacterium]